MQTQANTISVTAIANSAAVDNYGDALAVQVTGTFVATVEVQATADGTNFVTIGLTPAAGGATVTSAAAPGLGVAATSVAAYRQFRVAGTAWTSGTAVVTLAQGRSGE